MDAFKGPGNAFAAAGDSRSISAHFLAKRDGNGILQVGTAHLDDVFKFVGFDVQFCFQFFQRSRQFLAFHAQADFDARREDVVRRLGHVGVVVRRDKVVTAFFFAHDFQSPVAQYFVHVHIYRSTGTPLDRINRELVQPLTVDDFTGCLYQGIADFLVEPSRFHVGESSCFFDNGHGLDEVRIQMFPCNMEVFHSSHGLYAIINIIRYIHFT